MGRHGITFENDITLKSKQVFNDELNKRTNSAHSMAINLMRDCCFNQRFENLS